jgi:hypothetical protein
MARPFHTAAIIATFHRDAPARCGALADERRVVAGDEGQSADAKRLSSLLGKCGSAATSGISNG